MTIAFLGLAVRLQAVAHFMQQFADYRIAHDMSQLPQFLCEFAQTLARPAQAAFRIATRARLDQFFKIRHQCGIFLRGLLAAAPDAPDSARWVSYRLLQLTQPLANHLPRYAGRSRYLRDAAPTPRFAFSRDQQPPGLLIQYRSKSANR